MIRNSFVVALVLACTTGLAACTDDITQSTTPVGRYVLASVRGASVPVSDGAGALAVRSGYLVIRGDNSAFGVIRASSIFPVLNFDRYRISGERIEFMLADSVVNAGTVKGDSIEMSVLFYADDPYSSNTLERQVVFRRGPADPVAVVEGTYVLTTVGNIPLAQQPVPGLFIVYDTLRFSDGVFYRRSQKQEYRDAAGNSLGGSSSSWPGTYHGNSRFLLLGSYRDASRVVSAPTRDSLVVENGALILRSWSTNGAVINNRYEKQP